MLVALLLVGCRGHEIEFKSTASPTPTAPHIIHGTCNLAIRNKCLTGFFKSAPSTSTHYQWICNGNQNGMREFCQKNKPVAGVCNKAIAFHCSTGAFKQQKNTKGTNYTWQCLGLYGGSSANCSLEANSGGATNGACNSLVPNTCQAGTFTNTPDTNTHYKWTCAGINGGTTASCQANKPVNGACSTTENTCTSGTLEDIVDNSSHKIWLCRGSNGGITKFCYKGIAVNGTCGTKKDICSKGVWEDGTSSNSLADTTTHFKWKCKGQYGGTNTNCQINKPVNATCSTTKDTCTKGTKQDEADTSTHYQWRCMGQYGGTNSDVCQSGIPINGVCSGYKDTCSKGTWSDGTDTNTHYKWSCTGVNSGTTANCQHSKTSGGGYTPPAVNGSCNSLVANTCSAGTFTDVSDTTSHYKWKCVGLDGGTDASCQAAKPVNGVCSTTKDTCTKGTSETSTDSDTHEIWMCHGQNGGKSKICRKHKPINGACDNSKQNGCTAGTANDSAANDTSTHYKWRCDGVHSGTNSSTCQYNKPVNGVCSTTTKESCTAGTSQDIADTSVYYVWACKGQYGGATRFCHLNKPEAGVCGAARDTCHRGSYVAGQDTSTKYKWSCNGQYGSSTNAACTLTKTQTFSVPTKPTGVQAVHTSMGLRLSWLVPQNNGGLKISGYEVQWAAGSSAPNTWPAYSNNNSACESNKHHCILQPKTTDTTGHVRIRAVNALGKGTYSSSQKIVWGNPAKAERRMSRVSAGDDHTCVVTSSGNVKCWGNNASGQLGIGNTSTSSTPATVYADSNTNSNLSQIVQITTGTDHTCALTTDGKVKCWGANGSGRLGDGSSTARTTPVNVYADSSKATDLNNIIQVAAGDQHTCALTRNGNIKCYGENGTGQLGDGSSTDRNTPVYVYSDSGKATNLSNIIQITAGTQHTCAVTRSGGVKCWGNNTYGQLGTNASNQTTPVDAQIYNVLQITAGNYHTCALTIDGNVKCWGDGRNGQLGDGFSSDFISSYKSNVPVTVYADNSKTTPLSNILQISSNNNHTCALTSSGNVKCWGSGIYGQLGDGLSGTSYKSAIPIYVRTTNNNAILNGIASIGLGYNHSCGITNDNKAVCWGYSNNGQLGDSLTGDRDLNTSGTQAYTTMPVNVHTSSSNSNQLNIGFLFDHYQCTSSSCSYYRPQVSVSGSTATPTLTASNFQASDIITIYTNASCDISTKNKSTTVASGQTSATTTLASLGSSGTYKIYFTLQRPSYRTICLGPIYHTF